MDEALVRFQAAVAREHGSHRGRVRRYSVALQHQAIEYWRARERAGDGLYAVAAALRVAPVTLSRWARAYSERERFHEVRVIAAEATGTARSVVVVDATGVRVEGLDVASAAVLLRLLR